MYGPPVMAAIATLLNPLAEDELLTFWNNDSGDLVLVQRKNPDKPQDLIWTKTAKQTGIVKNPSSIVALQYQGLINVFGIISGASPVLKRLSPTVEPLPHQIPITQVASLASAVTADHKQAWLYYLGTNDQDATIIYEYPIDGSSEPQSLDDREPSDNTYLAATCWASGKRVLFFQNKSIKMVDVEQTSEVALGQTKSARNPTPMAACTAQDAQGNETLYLYYADNSNVLQRLTIKPSGDRQLTSLDKAPQLAAWTQLAATPGSTQNFISYVAAGGTKQKVTIFGDQRT